MSQIKTIDSKSARPLHPPNSTNHPLRPAKPSRIDTDRALRHLPRHRVMPASISGVHGAVGRGVLIPVDGVEPVAADLG